MNEKAKQWPCIRHPQPGCIPPQTARYGWQRVGAFARVTVGCQGRGWWRDRASGEPQTTTDGATHSMLSSTTNQTTARAVGCLHSPHTEAKERERREREGETQRESEGRGWERGERVRMGGELLLFYKHPLGLPWNWIPHLDRSEENNTFSTINHSVRELLSIEPSHREMKKVLMAVNLLYGLWTLTEHPMLLKEHKPLLGAKKTKKKQLVNKSRSRNDCVTAICLKLLMLVGATGY